MFIDERATSGLARALAAEGSSTRSSGSSVPATSKATSSEQEDSRQEHRGPGTPRESKSVLSDSCGQPSVVEAIADLDEDGTNLKLVVAMQLNS